jgi:glycine betaine/proline transport system substrate-binding protein
MNTVVSLLRTYWFVLVAIMAFVAGLLYPGTDQGPSGSGEGQARKTVRLVYVNWAEGIAMTNLAKVVLEDRMGYHVTMTMADPAPLFTSLAKGDNDAFLDAWLPVTHGDYMQQYGDRLADLGYNYEGARIGLVTPTYVPVDSIDDLPGHRNLFNGKIVGIDAGAGIMQRTEKVVTDYGLDYTLLASSGPAMTVSLKSAIQEEAPIVVTGWKPHWMFARWDLKFLDDPKGVYGESENLHTITRQDLPQDMPRVVTFLKKFKLDDESLGSLMGAINESTASVEETSREWMGEHIDLIRGWLPSGSDQRGSEDG